MEVLLKAAAAVAGTVTTDWVRVPTLDAGKLALIAAKKSGSGNADVKIENSPDAAAAFDWVTFTQLADASGNEELPAPNPAWPYIRAVYTVGGTGVYDLTVYLTGIYGGRRA